MAEAADPTFPVLEAAPRLYLDEQSINKAQVSLKTLHNCGNVIWDACTRLQLSLRAYSTAMMFVQSLLVLTPAATANLQASEPGVNLADSFDQRYSYSSVCGGCLLAATLSEDVNRKPELIAQAVNCNQALKIIELHREALESRGFLFAHEPVTGWVLKLGKVLRIRCKDLMHNAWLISADSCSTFALLQLPAPSIALACIRLAQVAFCAQNTGDVDRLSTDLGISQEDQARAMLLILDMYEYCRTNNLPTRGSLYDTKIHDIRSALAESIKDDRDLIEVPSHCQSNRSDISREGYSRYRFR